MAEKLFPTRSKTLRTIKDAGWRLHAFCLNPDCGWHADLDVDMLIARLGEYHSSQQPALVPLLVCSRCGGKDIAVEPSLAKEIPEKHAERVRELRRKPVGDDFS
jgi:hypothetical protein